MLRKAIVRAFRTAFVALALAAASAASAAQTLYFHLSGLHTADFAIISSPIPDASVDIPPWGGDFTIFNVAGTFDGAPTVFSQVQFITSGAFFGGFFIGDVSLNLEGDQLFSGTVEAPTFKSGSFLLDDGNFQHLPYHLTIMPAVPEPSSWALMLLGFAALGLWFRRSPVRVERNA